MCAISIAAQKKYEIKDVAVPDSIRKYLISYLDIESKDPSILISNLNNPRNKKFIDGIYIFGIMGADNDRRIFIKEKETIEVFVSTDINSILVEFIDYIKRLSLSDEKSVKYLKAICKYLNDYFVRN